MIILVLIRIILHKMFQSSISNIKHVFKVPPDDKEYTSNMITFH
jgi:hypothetical protein